jgi:hypothetical protein
MAKEEQPQSYERRILDTKGLAQRLDLNYIGRPHWLRTSRRILVAIALVLAVLTVIPILSDLEGSERDFSPGPLTVGHVAFEKNCRNCHVQPFERVQDADCRRCHGGSLQHFNVATAAAGLSGAAPAPHCAECHQQHRGNRTSAEMADANCTRCHADLSRHGDPVNLLGASRRINRFAWGSHPRFSVADRVDERPLKLNHAVHMALRASSVRPGVRGSLKLPMSCTDCHQMAPRNTPFEMVPVNFDMHCANCHVQELAFDPDQVLDPATAVVPHLKDVHAIRDYVYNAYRQALQKDPSIWRRPPVNGKALAPVATSQAWLDAATKRSVAYLFERKCTFCHEIEAGEKTEKKDGEPVIRKVNQILGQYSANRVEGVAWFSRAEFSHRMHRTTTCESCHTTARKSEKTIDVLIPEMDTCLPCHGSSGTYLDRCSECHVYHDRSQETARALRTSQELMRRFTPIPADSGRVPTR